VWLETGFGLVIGFIGHLQNVTTNNYDSLTELHTPKITVTTADFSVFTSHCLVATLKLRYDRRSSASQSILVSSPIWGPRPYFCYCQTVAGLLMWGALPDERMDLSYTFAADPRQRSHSRVRAPRDWWPYFSVSDSRLPKLWGPGPRIYIPQEQRGPVIPPGIWFPFHRLLRLAEL
jgi:hypothetical protein